ncbi:MAG: signal peptidase II [Lachnospiraceae bacterium]|nr:signal peptidase II [Lachnospiraceae bacterium]MCR5739650.1 signal peptidase II [Lachnospiraceae bacterium]
MASDPKIEKSKMAAICSVIVVVAVVLDQITKYEAVARLSGGRSIPIIEGILELYYIVNTGSSWGMLAGQKMLILTISVVIIALCIYMMAKCPEDAKYIPFNVCLSMIIAGGIGNGIDRIRFSYVIDFIYFKAIDFPVFNVADIFVTCGAFLFILLILFRYNEKDLEFMKPSAKSEEKDK